MALVVALAFASLLSYTGEKEQPRSQGSQAAAAVTPDTVPIRMSIPRGDPTNPRPAELAKPKRYEGEFPRWNLGELPEGWDPELAANLHAFFEAMEPEPRTPQPGIGATRKELRDYLTSLGPEALPTLATILNADPDFVNRRFLLYAIGDLGPASERATFVLRDFFMARRENPGSLSEALHTLTAMGQLQNDSSYEVLTSITKRGDLHNFRPKTIEVLGLHPRREEAVGMVIDHMHDDPMFNVRNKAAQFLGRVQNPQTLDEVYRAIDRERYWVVKQTMLGTVGKIGDPDSVPFLEKHAREGRESGVRLSAARAISRIDTPYAWEVLRSVLRTEPDSNVQRHIKKWLEAE